jgi:signal peptidase I
MHLALPFMAASFLIPLPSLWLTAALPAPIAAPAIVVFLVCFIGLALFAIVQAAIGARKAGSVSLAWFNRWFVYAGLIVLLTIWQSAAPLLPISSIKSYSIPSGGSIPTLLVGERFEAQTLAFSGRLPARGELAVLTIPSDPDVFYVKRIIGLPGDRIQIREGQLYLNDTVVNRLPVSDEVAAPLLQDFPTATVYREMMPGGASYLVAELGDNEALENTPEYLVPPNHVFVLGDNRDRSNDSRTKMGFIPIALLRDKPLFIYWSDNRSRIGKVVE